jgi:hypothetical protein
MIDTYCHIRTCYLDRPFLGWNPGCIQFQEERTCLILKTIQVRQARLVAPSYAKPQYAQMGPNLYNYQTSSS